MSVIRNVPAPSTERESIDHLIDRIGARDFTIGIVGLGYVGIPLALTACKSRFSVIGFDIDAKRVEQINKGESFIKHIPTRAIEESIKSNRFVATTDFDRMGEADAIIIAVPTPLTKNREPDLSFVEKTARSIAPRLRPNQLVVLESTTWPGTTEEIVKPILEATGLKSGTDFYLAFSPEREDPGNLDYNTSTIPKVVGGAGRRRAPIGQGGVRGSHRSNRAGLLDRDSRGGEADRKHLSLRQHRTRERAQAHLRQDGHRRVGGD